jgi:hypothetical protein
MVHANPYEEALVEIPEQSDRGSSGYDVPASRPNYACSLERSTPGLKVVASGTRMLVLPIGTGTTWGGKFSPSPPDGMASSLSDLTTGGHPY